MDEWLDIVGLAMVVGEANFSPFTGVLCVVFLHTNAWSGAWDILYYSSVMSLSLLCTDCIYPSIHPSMQISRFLRMLADIPRTR